MTDGPEKQMVRRALVPGTVAAAIAFMAGYLFAGGGAANSAALGVGVVVANFVASGLSLAWAAGISPNIVMIVGLGGFMVRLAVVAGIIVALRRLEWFSTPAFVAALVPTTLALLVLEMKMLSGRMSVDLWANANPNPAPPRGGAT